VATRKVLQHEKKAATMVQKGQRAMSNMEGTTQKLQHVKNST
jgi:hypothetical protein